MRNTGSRTLEEEKQIIAKAMQFPLDNVRTRYMRDTGVDAELAREHDRELRRFLIVCALAPPGRSIAMRGPIDEYWHTFLLFTRKYQRFCNEALGQFIHHVPAEPGVRDPKARRGYVTFLSEYERIFGMLPDVRFWPALLPTGDVQSQPSVTTGGAGECLFECDKCYPACEPVPCDNREPIDEVGTDTDTDNDSDEDDDSDTDDDVDMDPSTDMPSGIR